MKMFKEEEFVELYSDAELKLVWDTYTKNVCGFSLMFVPGPNFILLRDWHYRVDQLRKAVLGSGGSLVGVRFSTNWDKEYLDIAKRKATNVALTVLEDDTDSAGSDISFPWQMVKIPKLLRDLMMFKKTFVYGDEIAGLYGTMNRATFDKLKEFIKVKRIQCHMNSNQIYFSVYSPIGVHLTDGFYAMAKTMLGFPISFQANIRVGNLIIYLHLNESLADGEVKDLMDDIVMQDK